MFVRDFGRQRFNAHLGCHDQKRRAIVLNKDLLKRIRVKKADSCSTWNSPCLAVSAFGFISRVSLAERNLTPVEFVSRRQRIFEVWHNKCTTNFASKLAVVHHDKNLVFFFVFHYRWLAFCIFLFLTSTHIVQCAMSKAGCPRAVANVLDSKSWAKRLRLLRTKRGVSDDILLVLREIQARQLSAAVYRLGQLPEVLELLVQDDSVTPNVREEARAVLSDYNAQNAPKPRLFAPLRAAPTASVPQPARKPQAHAAPCRTPMESPKADLLFRTPAAKATQMVKAPLSQRTDIKSSTKKQTLPLSLEQKHAINQSVQVAVQRLRAHLAKAKARSRNAQQKKPELALVHCTASQPQQPTENTLNPTAHTAPVVALTRDFLESSWT